MCKAAAVQQVVSLACKIGQGVLRYVPCASTLLSWADKGASYIFTYTVAFIGIYGLNFNEGACVRACNKGYRYVFTCIVKGTFV